MRVENPDRDQVSTKLKLHNCYLEPDAPIPKFNTSIVSVILTMHSQQINLNLDWSIL